MNRCIGSGILFLLCAAGVRGGNTGVTISLHGACIYDMTRIQKSNIYYLQKKDPTVFAHRLDGTYWHEIEGVVGIRARISERIMARFDYSTRDGIDAGYVEISAAAVPKPPFVLTAGYFNYRYAPECENLGEYLYKTGIYPGYILSGVRGYDVCGLHLRTTIVPHLTQDLLLTTETNIPPAFDYSIAYVAHAAVADVITAGAGVLLYRVLSVFENNTTPMKYAIRDAETGENVAFGHDGIKCMARLAFDAKPLLPWKRLGRHDLTIYAEAALLGVKGYPPVRTTVGGTPLFEDNITHRIPIMAGVHLPTMGLLDVLAVEMEWYGSPYWNNPYNRLLPYPEPGMWEPGDVDNIKWSVSGRKEIIKGLEIGGRAARDHLRRPDGNGWFYPQEVTVLPEHWYWALTVTTFF